MISPSYEAKTACMEVIKRRSSLMTILTRGDDTDAFGRKFLKISVSNNTEHTISRAEWHCGKLIKNLGDNPTFPYYLELTGEESRLLQNKNECYLLCWDENGKRYTCPQKGSFETAPEK